MCCLSCSYTAPSESTLKDTGEDVKETLEEAGRELVEQGIKHSISPKSKQLWI